MGLNKKARLKVAEQLNKVADLLDQFNQAKKAESSKLSPFELFKRLSNRKDATLPDSVEEALLEAPMKEVKQVGTDVKKVQKEVNEMMPALERLDTRLRAKLGLPEDSEYLRVLNDAAQRIVDLSYMLQELETLSE